MNKCNTVIDIKHILPNLDLILNTPITFKKYNKNHSGVCVRAAKQSGNTLNYGILRVRGNKS
jgi:hypothetical protein